jgi:hypothetical protein
VDEYEAYKKFRTGLTFKEVRRMIWIDNPDPTTWPKGCSRRTVLGRWHEIKKGMFDYEVRCAGGLENYLNPPDNDIPF